jgi:hypothetical protein
MGFPDILCIWETRDAAAMFPPDFHTIAVDALQRCAYIGPGPHLPNEVLSFWKE